ncbi:MAG: type 1 periplasmic binding fold superfamily protein [Flavobacteriales bacterium]|nr:type 1 periplasmic binding fold superfamily protein [Flavobacteriales bacterium]
MFDRKPYSVVIVAVMSILLFSCEFNEIDPHHQEEPITTLYYTLTPIDDSSEKIVLFYQDIDGEGGLEPLIVVDSLDGNTSYQGELRLRGASGSPEARISHGGTTEISNLAEIHQVFYAPSSRLDMNISYTDLDNNGFPIGITTAVTTGNAGTGLLTISIRHEPNKGAPNVVSGDITHAGGSTDIEVAFEVAIK